MSIRIIGAIVLAAGLLVQTLGFAQVPVTTENRVSIAPDATPASKAETEALRTWRGVLENTPSQGKGCFHASYPNVAWENVDCKKATPRDTPYRGKPLAGAQDAAGNGYDFVAESQGLTQFAAGQLSGSGVLSETGIAPCHNCSSLGPLPNEYTLQLNTNTYNHNAVCGSNGNCYVWQQFIYAPDYNELGGAALYIQYWIFNWIGDCPSTPYGSDETNWWSDKHGNCYRNSKYAELPDYPVTQLNNILFYATARGGLDCVTLQYFYGKGADVYQVCENDSFDPKTHTGGVDIAGSWYYTEFNVFGNGGGTEAFFNSGSSFSVLVSIFDSSQSAPLCIPPQLEFGSTGETNNMTLTSNCQTGVGHKLYLDPACSDACAGLIQSASYMEFAEVAIAPQRVIIIK